MCLVTAGFQWEVWESSDGQLGFQPLLSSAESPGRLQLKHESDREPEHLENVGLLIQVEVTSEQFPLMNFNMEEQTGSQRTRGPSCFLQWIWFMLF